MDQGKEIEIMALFFVGLVFGIIIGLVLAVILFICGGDE